MAVIDSIKAAASRHYGLTLSDDHAKALADEWQRQEREADYHRSVWLLTEFKRLKKIKVSAA